MRRVKLLCSLIMLLASQGAQVVSYPLPPGGGRLVGSTLIIMVPQGNTKPLEAFVAQYGQGLSNMPRVNPGVDVFLSKSGPTLVMLQQLIFPDTTCEGIVTNVVGMRSYYYPAGSNTVEVLPIDIGQVGRETPRSWATVVERKQEASSWTPTPNIRHEYAARSGSLPVSVSAGPENPMGLYAIYISRLYAIHGTNVNFGIGLRVNQGCTRLRNDDIRYLFDAAPMGTRVRLIDRPVKYSEEPDGSCQAEVHEPLSRNRPEYEPDRKVPLPATLALCILISGDDVDVSYGS